MDITTLEKERAEFFLKEKLTLEKALTGTDIESIIKAKNYLKDIESRNDNLPVKSILIDPYQMVVGDGGYREKYGGVDWDLLKGMSRIHVVKAIIGTRKDQIKSFCKPQSDKYSVGFVIRKKRKNWLTGRKSTEEELSKSEMKKIEEITEMVISCGTSNNYWHADTFQDFIGKLVEDSLTYDQCNAEIVRDRKGRICEIFATDASTFRIAEGIDDNIKGGEWLESKRVRGYLPSYVQIYMGAVRAEFYPWELLWGIRNPSTSLYSNGYGRSELEDMVNTMTSLLNSDQYNSNFFKNGSAPKGILRYSGNISQNSIEEFRRQWVSQVGQVKNAHSVPIINADKMDFISTHIPNKDMEFSKYQEFQIKICCAIYKIDPSEIGFPMSGSSDSKPMFEGNNEARLKYSKDKGLKPLLANIEHWLNKYFVNQIDSEYELKFVGIDAEKDEISELEEDIKKLSNFMTINEIRKKYGLEDIEGGDIILNPTYYQALMQKQMQGQQGFDEGEGAGDEEKNPFEESDDEENPFLKSLQKDLPKILN
jgi:HK97 family phage portal protein